ncbi:MAG: NUDIX hydrolase [Ignavibacteria bacterium]|nr:NUDIX hydrolase [Ignavibacteria bacterium]
MFYQFVKKKTKRILLNYRSKYVNEPYTWGIYGGKLDSDEDIINTVKREFLEESGYDGQIDLIPAYVFRSVNGTFEYHNFIGVINDEFEPELDWESEGYKWVTFDELLSIKPKHFGLEELLADSQSIQTIKNIIK